MSYWFCRTCDHKKSKALPGPGTCCGHLMTWMSYVPLGNPTRPGWDEYFLGIATAVAARAECTRSKVGAVLVGPDHRIKSTGYNGAPRGVPNCLDGACPRAFSDVEPGSSYDTGAGACISIHAEANALLHARWEDCQGSTLYITRAPCDGCLKLIKGAGITRVVTPEMEAAWAA